MSQNLRVAAVQLTSGEDVTANADQILKILETLPSGVDLISLPENALWLRISKAHALKEIRVDDPEIVRLQKYVDRSGAGLMIGSVPHREGESVFNATVFLEASKVPRVVYRKLHLFDVDVPGAPPARESENFEYGYEPAILEWRGWKLGLSICYDLRFSELFHGYGEAGVDAILIPSAFLVPTGQAHWEILVRARAIENQCYVIAPAQGGEHVSLQGEKRYTYGHSMVVSPWGEKLVELTPSQKAGVVELEKTAIEKVRRQIPMRSHRMQRRWENQK